MVGPFPGPEWTFGYTVKRADEQFSAQANSNKESQQADHITSAEWPTRGLHTAGRAAAAP